jgi:hypothetical protein
MEGFMTDSRNIIIVKKVIKITSSIKKMNMPHRKCFHISGRQAMISAIFEKHLSNNSNQAKLRNAKELIKSHFLKYLLKNSISL